MVAPPGLEPGSPRVSAIGSKPSGSKTRYAGPLHHGADLLVLKHIRLSAFW